MAPSLLEAHHIETVRVSWADTDAGGGMHFSAGLRYAEAAEAGFRRRLGILDDWGRYPRRTISATFHSMLRFDDELEVRLRLESVGTTSISWAWEIVRGAELCIEGRHVAVHVGADQRPRPLPAAVRSSLEQMHEAEARR